MPSSPKEVAISGVWKPAIAGLIAGALWGAVGSKLGSPSQDWIGVVGGAVGFSVLSSISWYRMHDLADGYYLSRVIRASMPSKRFWTMWSIVSIVGWLVQSAAYGAGSTAQLFVFLFLIGGAGAAMLQGFEFLFRHELEVKARELIASGKKPAEGCLEDEPVSQTKLTVLAVVTSMALAVVALGCVFELSQFISSRTADALLVVLMVSIFGTLVWRLVKIWRPANGEAIAIRDSESPPLADKPPEPDRGGTKIRRRRE